VAIQLPARALAWVEAELVLTADELDEFVHGAPRQGVRPGTDGRLR
jgi:hypothetical protein